jgi:hypothetical protein
MLKAAARASGGRTDGVASHVSERPFLGPAGCVGTLRNSTFACRLVLLMGTRTSKSVRLPQISHAGSISLLAVATAAVAFGALAIGALAIGRLAVGKAHIRSLKIDHLNVERFDLASNETLGVSDRANL